MFCSSLIPTALAGNQLTAFLVVICFAAGLNVYATVAALGVLAHTGILTLPSGLGMLASWYVIGAAVALFAVEFVGDKIPVFDLLWNALHTFVRIPAAAVLAYAATAQLPEWQRLLATLVGALIALAAHEGKIAARTAVTQFPEPFSNAALSVSEDAAVVFLTWFATKHAYAAAAIVLVALGIIAIMIRVVARAVRDLFRNAEGELSAEDDSSARRAS
jgi:hypothetical protein